MTDWLAESWKLKQKADALRNSGTSKQNMTPRRKRIYEGQLAEAAKLDDLAAACRGMADRSRPLSPHLIGIKSVEHLRIILSGKSGFAKDALLDLIGLNADHEQAEADALKKAELELVGMDIEGFFPTPPDLIDLMLRCADIGPDVKRILEPSAGKGDIVAAAQEAAPWAEVIWCETSPALIDFTTKRCKGAGQLWSRDIDGYEYSDFLKTNPDQSFDLVLMNPPFENGQDMAHVLHAFKYLKPQGRLVAIVSEGPFFRPERMAEGFRKWLSVSGAWVHKLPADAFNKPGAFRRTGVQTRLIVVDASQAAVAAA